ncbi:MFS transporter [Rhodococcus sp. 06-221-2]|uniref:MFS transporter n=1 Tax=Rhodococcus sp. 06-221-2 TaxID=2022514 RepID=UPI000B9A8A1D|nr:MFS transporter [Rhodococcus sp. 06-221-2]OZD00329.1 MFS transporter [Rhodococcus sp. 06-221-2]
MSENTDTEPGSANTTVPPGVPLSKVATSVVLGTTIEWYDFMLYGAAAATVFGPLFFPDADAFSAALLSFSTFAVGFAARPLGGIIFGHFGDRVGRKKMLVLSLTMMGVATVLMGLIPSYESIGIAAPLLLVVLRVVQGFGVGGEWGGAVLTAIEHAPPSKRAFYGSLPQVGVPAGLLASTLAFLAVSQLPEDQFLSWGWRIPFLASAILVAIGMYIRLNVEETPAFKQVSHDDSRVRIPALVAITQYPRQIGLTVLLVAGSGVYFYTITTYSLSYATTTEHLTRTEMLSAQLTAAAVMVGALLFFGKHAERLGLARMIGWGLALLAVWVFPVFWAIETGSAALTTLAFAIHGVIFAVSYAPLSTFVAQHFAPHVRFSASSISFQTGVLLGGAIAPMIATALVDATGTIYAVCLYAALAAAIGVAATAVLARRTPMAISHEK